MKRSTRTIGLAFTLGTLALLARGQNPAPLSPASTVEQAAGQQSNLAELTLLRLLHDCQLRKYSAKQSRDGGSVAPVGTVGLGA